MSLEAFVLKDPWEGIQDPIYPDAKGFYFKDNQERMWASMDEDKNLVYFIQIPKSENPEIIESLNGVKIEIKNLSLNGKQFSRLIFTLEEVELRDQFTLMTISMALRLNEVSDNSIFVEAKKELKEWSIFLKPDRKGLTREEHIGLWGELHVFSEFMLALHPLTDAVNFWVGPNQKKQDFTMNNLAVETKTSLSGDGSLIRISSLDQLQKVTDKLYLTHIFINQSSEDALGKSLNDFFYLLEEKMSDDLESLIKFQKKVGRFRNKATETQLDEKFYFLDLKIYEINDGFPKVSRQEIPNTAVLNVKYSIDTSLLSEFQIETPIQDLICHG